MIEFKVNDKLCTVSLIGDKLVFEDNSPKNGTSVSRKHI